MILFQDRRGQVWQVQQRDDIKERLQVQGSARDLKVIDSDRLEGEDEEEEYDDEEEEEEEYGNEWSSVSNPLGIDFAAKNDQVFQSTAAPPNES